jgi:acyl-CoA synthetase (NDP forming)/GNAT superfamily N-acetyltransferase
MTAPASGTAAATRPDSVAPRGGPVGGIDALLADGAIIRIRPIRPADVAELTALHEGASDETLYRRFLSTGHHGIAGEVARITRPADMTFAALVAVERGRIVGVCSYELLPGGAQAEFAVFIDDAAHGRGIGTLLLEHLGVHARRHGVPDLLGEVLPTNVAMLRVVTALGQPLRTVYDLGLVQIHVDTASTGSDIVDVRDLAAARRSLRALFTPGCIAVVGAGRKPGGIGHTVLRAIVDGGFTGAVFAVNPGAEHIGGVAAYPSIALGPHAPDLVVIAVPAPKVAGVLADAAAAGARAAVILSSGFGEEGPGGRARQAELVRIARTHGMRIVGPNCLGFLNTDPAVRLNATFAAAAVPGGLAVASQSGAVGIALLDQAAAAGLGIASFVSLGNKADVSGNDLLSYWYDEPAAKVVALYLESLGNPRRFARIARAVARRKPVLAVKSGRSTAGARVGASHTAAAAAPDATVDALFAQAGVVRCDGLGDLLDTARMLADQPLPAGDRVAIVGNAGGINVLCADAADACGLTLPELPADVQAAIRVAASGAAAVTNPVDLGAAATAEAMGAAIRAIAPHVDAIVVAFGATLAAEVSRIVEAIAVAVDDVPVPVAVVLLGVVAPPTHLGARRAPVYPLPERAIGALGRTVRYAAWRRTPIGQRPDFTGIDAVHARRLVTDALAAGGGWQAPDVAGELLGCYGIRVTAARAVATNVAAVTAATSLGFPVVLKSANPDLVHKSDIGGVRLDLGSADAVAAAYHEVVAATADPRVLVQVQSPAGVELVAGIAHDPLFGSVLICGLGGIQTNLLGDRTLRLLPVTDRDAARMWRDLRAAPLLTGYRGAPPVDTASVEDLLLRLGRLAEDLPEVAELDLNPVIAGPAGLAVVDVKIRIADVGREPDPALRALREPA